MKNKYYIPKIEEFHVGFECEIRNSSGDIFDWEHFKIVGTDDAEISDSLMDWSFYDSDRAIKEEQIRVKYLDKEDIESLGFIQDERDPHFYETKDESYWINIDIDGKTSIDSEDNESNFYGYIKNKSELKKVLQQIGIINL